MFIQTLFSNAKRNRAIIRIQLARIMRCFFVLAFLISTVGVNPALAANVQPSQARYDGSPSTIDNGTQATFTDPGVLNYISVTPNPATIVVGATRQFSAQGYDVDNNPIPGLTYTWSVANGGGSINPAGLFTAGTAAGHFDSTVVAAVGSISGTATVDVTTPQLDHFTFDPIPNPQYAGVPFQVTITARDAESNTVVNYGGQVQLSAGGGVTLSPTQSGMFNLGKWTGLLTLSATAAGVTIAATDADHSVISNAFDVQTLRACPCSIWDDTTLPDQPNVTDNQPIEVGIRFRVDVDGYVNGVRFYKGSLNTGTHIGHLWTNTGMQLAEATFTDESASGWQYVTFVPPVAVQAGITYVASYHSSAYFADNNGPYFTAGNTAAYTNPPVRGMPDGADGLNGLFKYGASAFPDQAWSQSNYWVDVVFNTQVGPDTTPPAVISVTPINNASTVAIAAALTAQFNEAVDSATLIDHFELRDAANALVAATLTYNASTRTATLAPNAPLAYSTAYHATLLAGIADTTGNATTSDYTWSFTTAAEPPPPPDEGPGGPILVIADATNVANPFGRYYAEILRGEGFNAFTVTDISQVSSTTLANFNVVLLAEMPLSSAQVTMLDKWVSGGGKLIAFRPAKSLATLYGLTDAGNTTSEAYLAVDTSTAIGKGLIGDSLQFHGTADNYTLSGATSVATLYTNATTSTSYPAIASYTRGNGQVVIFTFDLARSIILMRQGNPAWAGTEGDGHSDAIRATDLFVHGSQSWLDANKIAIPQADEQMHILSHAIEQLTVSKLPLPRLWYFPNQVKGALIMTGDSEGCSTACVNLPMADVNAHGGHYTVYLEGNGPSSADVTGWLSAGNGVGAHYNDTANATDPTYNNMKTVYDTETPAFLAAYGFMPATVRNHWVLWAGWADQAKVEVEHGLGLDTNYYHWGSWNDTPGYFTGSGLPLRFSDENGNILDIFQVTTQLPDETWFNSISTQFKTLIDRSIDQGYYGFITANFHPPSYGTYQTSADSMMDYANARGVPIWSAEQLNDFIRARNQARTQNMSWNGTLLKFDFNALTPYNGLTLMIPAKAGGHSLVSLEIGSTSVPYTITMIKGYDYALFTAANGSYTASYDQDTTAPTIASHTPVDNATNVAANSNVTVTFSEAMDPTTITGTTFSLQADGDSSNGAASVAYDAASMMATLIPNAPLSYSTLYHVTVSGSVNDISNNMLGSDQTWIFTTQAAPAPSLTDTSTANFSAGTLNSCVADATMGDGAVRLPAGVDVDFSGTTLPTGWTSYDWPYDTKTGVYSVSGGLLSVDGLRVNPDPAAYGPGSSLEFIATFAAIPNQHIGFGSGSNLPQNSVFDNDPPVWAIFSTGPTGSGLMARTWSDAGHTDYTIPGSWLGSPHLYRIDWNSTSATYFIDGSQVASQAYSSTGTTMRPAISDLTQDGTVLNVDSMRVTPYVSPCTFTSRVFDAGSPVSWGTMSWNATFPSGTSLALSYRRGNTPVPDGSWTEFSSVPSSGSVLSGSSRYIQYQAGLSASDTSQTPALQDVTITYATGGPDITPPTVTARTPAPNATGVAADTNVTVTFDEAMNAGSINGSTFSLRADGAGSDIPAAVTYDAGSMTATLNPNANLAYSTLYHVTVSGTVSDAAINPLGSADTWSFTNAAAPDLTPPTVTAHTPTPNATGVATDTNVTVTFNEAMNTGSFTGGTFSLRADGAGSDIPAAVTYDAGSMTATLNPNANLAYSTLYHVTVSSIVTDLAGNPLGSDSTWNFTTATAPLPVLSDTTAADFSAGTLNSCVADATIGDGAVRLPLVIDEGFSGTVLPTTWAFNIWSGSASPTVGSGLLSVNGNEAYTSAVYTAGHTLQFRATFDAHAFETVGFAGGNPPLNSPPWLQFGTGSTGTELYARILATGDTAGGGDDMIPLGTAYLGSPHTYRIDWKTNGLEFFIDGISVVSRSTTLNETMHVVASDYTSDASSVTVDWIQLTPYATPCAFTSRVFDAGQSVNWDTMSWNSDVPASTSLSLSYRIGSTPTLDAMHWVAITGNSPKALAGNSRYIQYQAALSASDATVTPDLRDVTFAFHTGADTTAPIISALSAVPDTSGNAVITWNTDEPSDSLVQYGTTPNILGLSGSSAALVTAHTITLTSLVADTTYYYRVTSKDAANNSTTSPVSGNAPASFATPPITHTLTDTTTSDFTAGTLNSCVADATIGDGALRLPLTIDENFSGMLLPNGWSSTSWTGGAATVSNGLLMVNGASGRNNTLFSPGIRLEFVATFAAKTYQHIGFGGGDVTFNQAPMAMFSTRADTTTLYTSLYIGSTYYDIAIPNSGSLIGTPHSYRIDWKTNGFDFYVDGNLVSSRSNVVSEQMRFAASDYSQGGSNLTVDWVQMTPYVSPCSFTSRVFDAGQNAHWIDLSKVGAAPTGTSTSFETRTGNFAVPDGTWSAWQAVNSPIASPNGRYIQYRSSLSTTDTSATPVIESVTLTSVAIPEYTLTYTAGAGGSITGTSPQTVAYGANGTAVTAVPEVGYHFVDWSDASTANPRTETNVTANVDVTANFAVNTFTLNYAAGAGGSLTGNTSQTIDYGKDGTAVTAVPAVGYHFVDWSDASSANSRTDTNVMANVDVTANFAINTYDLSVSMTGIGSGAVASDPAGIICGSICSSPFNYNTLVTLTAVPTMGSSFSGWSGAGCSGTDSCQVTMNAAQSVTATFTQDEYTLAIEKVGSGAVTKMPDQGSYHYGDVVTLNVTAADGWTFTGWTPTLTDNKVTITGDTTITANFTQDEYTLTVISAHSTVTKTPDQANYHYGDIVTLGVTSVDPGWTFTGWMPALTDNKVTIHGDTLVIANFTQNEYTLNIVSDHGTVTKVPNQDTYHYGNTVTLSATTADGWTFTDWTPSLTGNTVTITGNTSITANYSQIEYTLTINKTGNGTVTADVAGPYHYGTEVKLAAAPALGWSLDRWTGDAAGTINPVTVTMDGDKTVTASFTQNSYTLAVTSLNGAVTKTPAQTTYHLDDVVALEATPAAGWTFTDWSGDVTNTVNPIDVTIAGNMAVTANYSQNEYILDVTSLHGTVTKVPQKATYHYGDIVTLSMTTNPGWTFTGWSGAGCSGTGTCNVTMDAAKSVTAMFTQNVHSISLTTGWNLVSFNLHPVDSSLTAVLTSIAGSFDLVYAWDATGGHAGSGNWLKYAPSAPSWSNSLSNLDETMGFWIHMTVPDTLEVVGNLPTTTNMTLSTLAGGWNLVSYPSSGNLSLPSALRDHGVGTDYSLVYAYHANDTADPWKLFDRSAPAFASDLTSLDPGWGYWVKVSASPVWDVEY
jgi:hypothetical protein